jgi:hypothetical protein
MKKIELLKICSLFHVPTPTRHAMILEISISKNEHITIEREEQLWTTGSTV